MPARLSFAGKSELREGFGVTTILRHVLEIRTGVPYVRAVAAKGLLGAASDRTGPAPQPADGLPHHVRPLPQPVHDDGCRK